MSDFECSTCGRDVRGHFSCDDEIQHMEEIKMRQSKVRHSEWRQENDDIEYLLQRIKIMKAVAS